MIKFTIMWVTGSTQIFELSRSILDGVPFPGISVGYYVICGLLGICGAHFKKSRSETYRDFSIRMARLLNLLYSISPSTT